jgi:hypothetical protein
LLKRPVTVEMLVFTSDYYRVKYCLEIEFLEIKDWLRGG